MKAIRNIFKWVLLLILGIVALFLINIGWQRLHGLTDDQRAALALVEAPLPRLQGHNAFALTWLISKDVPDVDIDQLAARDVEYARAHNVASSEELKFPSADLPNLADPDPKSPALCAYPPADCLATVRQNPESTRALLLKHHRLLERAIQLETFDYLNDEFPHQAGMPVAFSTYPQRLRSSQLALMFDDGERSEAVAGACRNLSMLRRFGRDSRSLIQAMLAVNRRDAALQLLAAMLAELEPGQALPAECTIALAPVTAAEVSLCSAMIGEFDYADGAMAALQATGQSGQQKGWFDRTAQALVLDLPRTRAWRAKKAAGYCGSEVATEVLQDRLSEQPHLNIGWFDCQANLIGCVLTRTAEPAFNGYDARLLDSAAHLRLAATLAWLRETEDSGQTLQQRFDSRPQELRSGSRVSGISEDGGSIWVDNLYTEKAERFSLPLAITKDSSP